MSKIDYNIENVAKLINISGRQRMLSQRIAFLISASLNNEAERSIAQKAIQLFESSHAILRDGNNEFPSSSRSEKLTNYFMTEHNADKKINDFIKHSKDIINGEQSKLEIFFQISTNDIVPLLNIAVTIYEDMMANLSAKSTEDLVLKDKSVLQAFKNISEISRQVKFISFNASIIASRAGGRVGAEFEVVSSEMQKLVSEIDNIVKSRAEELDEN